MARKQPVNVRIRREMTIAASHRLHNLPDGAKCSRSHGHNYRIVVELEADAGRMSNGMVADFGHVKDIVDSWDHYSLNDLPSTIDGVVVLQPTAEHMAICLGAMLARYLPATILTIRVEVYETPTCCAIIEDTPTNITATADALLEEWERNE